MQSLGASRIWGSGCFGKRALAVPPAVRLSALCRPVELDEAHQLWLARATPVVDVRSPREFRSEALQHAINVPLLQIPTTFPLSAIDFLLSRTDKPPPPFDTGFERGLIKALAGSPSVLLVCSDGRRSAQAASLLAEEDICDALWLRGGMVAWLAVFSARGVPRKRVQNGVFVDSGPTKWTDSAEEDTVLPARGGNTRDVVIDG